MHILYLRQHGDDIKSPVDDGLNVCLGEPFIRAACLHRFAVHTVLKPTIEYKKSLFGLTAQHTTALRYVSHPLHASITQDFLE